MIWQMNKNNETKAERLNEENLNNQGCLMKIVEYTNAHDIIVEFQDKYRARIHTEYKHFASGSVKNPYFRSVFGVGMIGEKYPMSINGKMTKEHFTWRGIISRCYDNKRKEKSPTYENVVCCEEWLNFDNFYEWLHSQSNFDKWYEGKKWAIDKDILIKGNKVYSPNTCCLVPENVNLLFTKRDRFRGNFPIGVRENGNGFQAQWNNQLTNKRECSSNYSTPENAFYFGYKPHKEALIKQVAEIEYNNGNITKQCYDSMMNYKVEITD